MCLGSQDVPSASEAARAALLYGEKDSNVFIQDDGAIHDCNGTPMWSPGDTAGDSGDWTYYATLAGGEFTEAEIWAIRIDRHHLLRVALPEMAAKLEIESMLDVVIDLHCSEPGIQGEPNADELASRAYHGNYFYPTLREIAKLYLAIEDPTAEQQTKLVTDIGAEILNLIK